LVAVWPLAVRAQAGKVRRIGFMSGASGSYITFPPQLNMFADEIID
jgi:hypothetical protein